MRARAVRRYAFESVSVMSGRVWIRAPQDSPEPYVLATVTSTDGNAIYSVHVDGVERHVVLEQDAWLANEDGDGSPDASQLAHVNLPAVLHWLRLRAERGLSFSAVAERLLVWLAPLKPNPRLYSVVEMMRAAAAGAEGAEPHVYALVEHAWRAAMRRDTALGGARTQAIVLQGDAGSGQAELSRQAVEYWVWRAAPALAHETAAARGLALRNRLRQCELVLQAVGHARSGGSRDACRFSKVWRVLSSVYQNVCSASMPARRAELYRGIPPLTAAAKPSKSKKSPWSRLSPKFFNSVRNVSIGLFPISNL